MSRLLQCFDANGEYIGDKVESIKELIEPSSIIDKILEYITQCEKDILGVPTIEVAIRFMFTIEIRRTAQESTCQK